MAWPLARKSRRPGRRSGRLPLAASVTMQPVLPTSNAVRLRITRVAPFRRISSFFLRLLSNRVTVSRNERGTHYVTPRALTAELGFHF